MTPYRVLAEVAKERPGQSILEVWNDFACWERAREYRDDPNAISQDDIDWITTLYELAVRLDDRQGDIQQCRNAIESAAAAFAALEHEPQLYDAIVEWRKWRLEEIAAE